MISKIRLERKVTNQLQRLPTEKVWGESHGQVDASIKRTLGLQTQIWEGYKFEIGIETRAQVDDSVIEFK